jgi:hypothetical protein
MAVSAGPTIAAELIEIAIIKRCTASRDRIAGRLVAIECGRSVWGSVLPETGVRSDDRSQGKEREHREEGN